MAKPDERTSIVEAEVFKIGVACPFELEISVSPHTTAVKSYNLATYITSSFIVKYQIPVMYRKSPSPGNKTPMYIFPEAALVHISPRVLLGLLRARDDADQPDEIENTKCLAPSTVLILSP